MKYLPNVTLSLAFILENLIMNVDSAAFKIKRKEKQRKVKIPKFIFSWDSWDFNHVLIILVYQRTIL